ncbi:hypothetical protein [Pseudodesulfovibrio senegalensis]|nr:hypothetical protein [Pseudodesulfovibrio senegalensis]
MAIIVFAALSAAIVLWLVMRPATREIATVDWTGTNGVVEIFDGDRLARRYMGIDELSTLRRVKNGMEQVCRAGRGYLDANLNFMVDPDEKKVYFEISEFTNYIFFEQPDITDQ